MKRKIIHIDEEKCDGCGQCVPACAEGAIQVLDGKARLVSEVYCDGLGACLGECPQGAITIDEREAPAFDEEAARKNLELLAKEKGKNFENKDENLPCGCPGSLSRSIERGKAPVDMTAGSVPSHLANWPVQITLVPSKASYLAGAGLLIAADCVPFAFGDFHRRFVEGKVVMMGCPKLDDAESYIHKLAEIFRRNDIRSIETVIMEVPCCSGLDRVVRLALEEAGKKIPVSLTRVGIRGDILP